MIKNLTPHNVTYIFEDGKKVELPPAGNPVRVASGRKNHGKLLDLPPREEKTLYIVSAIARQRTSRNDFISPANLVIGEDGKVCGCTAFMMNGYLYPVSFKDGKVVTVPFNPPPFKKQENFAFA